MHINHTLNTLLNDSTVWNYFSHDCFIDVLTLKNKTKSFRFLAIALNDAVLRCRYWNMTWVSDATRKCCGSPLVLLSNTSMYMTWCFWYPSRGLFVATHGIFNPANSFQESQQVYLSVLIQMKFLFIFFKFPVKFFDEPLIHSEYLCWCHDITCLTSLSKGFL